MRGALFPLTLDGQPAECFDPASSQLAGKTHWIDLSATSPSDAESLQGEDASCGICRNRCPAPLGPLEVQGALNERKLTQLSAADHSARESMKDAAKCVN